MYLAKGLVVVALLAVLETSTRWPFAYAEEESSVPTPAPAESDADAASGDEKTEPVSSDGGESGDTDEAKGQAFVDSAKELQEKLAQLKALLDAKGDSADPALKERLSGLEDQLKGLGLDGLSGGGGTESNPALTEFLGACLTLAMRRTGIQRPATLGALRRLSDKKLSPEEASKVELWRMVAVCVTDFTEEEYADYKAGKMKVLPKAYVDAASKPEATAKVTGLEAKMWEELRSISKGLLKELVGDTASQKPPIMYGLLALVPLAAMVGFMFKLFRDMKKKEEEKNSAKKKKEAKKDK